MTNRLEEVRVRLERASQLLYADTGSPRYVINEEYRRREIAHELWAAMNCLAGAVEDIDRYLTGDGKTTYAARKKFDHLR